MIKSVKVNRYLAFVKIPVNSFVVHRTHPHTHTHKHIALGCVEKKKNAHQEHRRSIDRRWALPAEGQVAIFVGGVGQLHLVGHQSLEDDLTVEPILRRLPVAVGVLQVRWQKKKRKRKRKKKETQPKPKHINQHIKSGRGPHD